MPSDSDAQLPDLRYIRELAKVFRQYGLDEIEIETADQRLLLRKGDGVAATRPAVSPAPVPTPVAAAVAPLATAAANTPTKSATDSAADVGDFITSPFVGTFYRSPRPDAPPFVELGASVAPGQTICIVEAMKLFNEIETEFPCVMEECLVENGQAVEYGARLFRVRKL